jgi:hypothetical protein
MSADKVVNASIRCKQHIIKRKQECCTMKLVLNPQFCPFVRFVGENTRLQRNPCMHISCCHASNLPPVAYVIDLPKVRKRPPTSDSRRTIPREQRYVGSERDSWYLHCGIAMKCTMRLPNVDYLQ